MSLPQFAQKHLKNNEDLGEIKTYIKTMYPPAPTVFSFDLHSS